MILTLPKFLIMMSKQRSRPAKYIYLVNNIKHQTPVNSTTLSTALKDLSAEVATTLKFSNLLEDTSLLQNAS